MNKISAVVLLAVLALFGSNVLAQNTTSPYGNGAAKSPMGMNPMVTKEKIDQSMEILLEIGLLYKMMGQPTMVATDNGIIVAYGNTLRKYDKDLNVIKEVELDVNPDAMQEVASKLAKNYSSKIMDLMGGMTGSTGASPGYSTSPSTSTAAGVSSKSLEDQKEEEIKKEIEQMK